MCELYRHLGCHSNDKQRYITTSDLELYLWRKGIIQVQCIELELSTLPMHGRVNSNTVYGIGVAST